MSAEALAFADALRWGETPFKYVHDKCGKVAFYMTENPPLNSLMLSHIIRTIDGGRILPFADCRCGSCGELMAPHRAGIVPTYAGAA